MAADLSAQERDDAARRPARWFLAMLVIAAIVFAVQAWSYSGLIYRLAEWQFAWFGRYFPTLTVILLLTVAALLWLGIARLRRWIARRTSSTRHAELDAAAIDRAHIGFARRFFQLFTLGAAAAALGTFIHYMQLPTPTSQLSTFDLRRGNPTLLPQGSTRIDGITALGPIARYGEDIIIWRETIYLVPVARTRLENGTDAANLFVQINAGDSRAIPSSVTGLLRNNALPHEIRALYRNASYPVADDSAVLFADATTADRPSLIMAIKLALLAIIGGLFLWFTRRKERIARQAAELETGD